MSNYNDDPLLLKIPGTLLMVSDRPADIDEALRLKLNYYALEPVTTKNIYTDKVVPRTKYAKSA